MAQTVTDDEFVEDATPPADEAADQPHPEPEGSQEQPQLEAAENTGAESQGTLSEDEQAENGEQPQNGNDTVPHATYHQAHRERQELRRENRQLNENFRVLEERTNALLNALQGNQQLQPPPQAQQSNPSDLPPEDDLMGRLDWVVNRFVEHDQQQAQHTQQARQYEAQEAQYKQMRDVVVQDLESAAAANPKLNDTVTALHNSYVQEALASGYSQQEAEQYATQTERFHVARIYETGASASAYVTRLAQGRFGANMPVANAPNGGQQRPAPQQSAQPTPEDRRSMHVSLSQVSGSEGVSGLDAKMLANASEDEFHQIMRAYGPRVDQLMGATG